MSRPIIKIVNVETGEELEREMNDQEFATWDSERNIALSRQAELAAKAQARQALLDKLGITEDEAKLLLGGN